MSDKPLVSIIVPVYNKEDRLEKTLNSIINQTYQNLEIILVDDGSSDSSIGICRNFSKNDERIRIFSQSNRGASAARNLGIEKVTGKIVTFCDADDVIESVTIEKSLSCLENNDLDLLIYGISFDYYKQDGVEKSEVYKYRENVVFDNNQFSDHFIELYDIRHISSVCNKLFRAEIIRDKGIRFNEEMSILEDLDFVLDYIEASDRTGVVAEDYYHYYHDLSDNLFLRRSQIDYLQSFRKLDYRINQFCRNMGITDEVSRGYMSSVIFETYLIHLRKLFVSELTFYQKHQELSKFVEDEDVRKSMNESIPRRRSIRILKQMVKKKSVNLLYLLLWGYSLR